MKRVLAGSVVALAVAAMPLAGQGPQVSQILKVEPAGPVPDRVVLQGNVHPAVRDLVPVARTDAGLPMEHMILSFRMRPEARSALERLLADQQNPASPDFHKWLSPDEFASAFGPRPEEVAKVASWLGSQGFTVEPVTAGGMSMNFSGTAGMVEEAFRVPMMDYLVQGSLRHANAADPSIPADLADLVGGVVTLHNIPLKAMNTGFRPLSTPQYNFTLNNTTNHYLGPADFAVIYDLNPLYSLGINGSGVSIAIAGRTVPSGDPGGWNQFRTEMNLSTNQPTTLTPNGTVGDQGADEDGEADLDVEWSGGVAPGASILFVASPSGATDGVYLSSQYIVNYNQNGQKGLAPIMSVSFGLCEQDMSSTENQFYSLLWAQAASEGISVFVASGDDGASGCAGDVGGMDAGSLMRAVNGISSTPSNICVGGTMFTEGNGAGTYWSTGPSDYPSALKYIPEAVWYEPANADFAGGASGGGVSTLYSKPSWQVAPGVPAGNRWVPDVALAAAAEHDGYVIYTTGSIGPTLYSAGGTSAASPSFAGIMALVVQATGQRWGNFNTVLYQFGNAQYSTGGNVFHDITTGGNTNWNAGAPAGYPATTGFDPATGLGSVDAANLVDNMNAGITTSLSSAGVITGGSAIFTATVTGIQDVGVTWSVTPAGAKVTPGTPTSTATFTASRAGTYTVTASPSEAALHTASISVQVHDPHLTGAGNTVTGLDVLFLLSQYGSGTAADLNGDGMVDDKDLAILLNLLQTQGW